MNKNGRSACCNTISLSKFFQLPVNVRLVRILPEICFKLYMYLLGSIYFSIRADERKTIRLALQYIFSNGLACGSCFAALLRTFKGIFDHYLEKLRMAHLSIDYLRSYLRIRLLVSDSSLLEQLRKNKRGALLVTGHFGAVEYLPLALSIHDCRTAMIVKFKTAALKKALLHQAEAINTVLIDAEEPNVLFKALAAMKEGRILITECDEFSHWLPDKARKVNVFNNPVPMDKTLDFLSRRAGVPVFLGLMKRQKGNFMLCLESLTDSEKTAAISAKTWKVIEKYILNFPYQWYQWKSAARDLSPYINWNDIHANKDNFPVDVKDSVYSAHIT